MALLREFLIKLLDTTGNVVRVIPWVAENEATVIRRASELAAAEGLEYSVVQQPRSSTLA